MDFELTIDRQTLLITTNRYLGRVLEAGVVSVRTVTRGLEKDLEAATRVAAGGKLWRAWQSVTYPKHGGAYEPSGSVFLKGRTRTRGAISYWSTPGTNRKSSGEYLAIPTKNAGVMHRQRHLPPGEWERKHGVRLEYIYRGSGKPALLVADVLGRTTKSGSRRFVGATAGRRKRAGGQSVRKKIIFVLIAQQRHANAFSAKPLFEKAQRELPKDYAQRVIAAIQQGR